MQKHFNQIIEQISVETSTIDIEGCDISMEDTFHMVEFIQDSVTTLRFKLLKYKFEDAKDEICFFKEMKPLILSRLLYFNKIYTIELKRQNESNISQKGYYEHELDSLTFFFNRNLDFYQYYRSSSTHLD